jgi:hypothetical protein
VCVLSVSSRLYFVLTGRERIATKAKAAMMTREVRNMEVFCILLVRLWFRVLGVCRVVFGSYTMDVKESVQYCYGTAR